MSIKNLSLRRPDHRYSTRREKWSKLKSADLDAIAAAYARGDRVSDIAERFGISHSTPTDIARRKGGSTSVCEGETIHARSAR